jgi:hypothetical protein
LIKRFQFGFGLPVGSDGASLAISSPIAHGFLLQSHISRRFTASGNSRKQYNMGVRNEGFGRGGRRYMLYVHAQLHCPRAKIWLARMLLHVGEIGHSSGGQVQSNKLRFGLRCSDGNWLFTEWHTIACVARMVMQVAANLCPPSVTPIWGHKNFWVYVQILSYKRKVMKCLYSLTYLITNYLNT